MLYCQDHVFVFTKEASSNTGVWIPGFLAVFSLPNDPPRLAWTSYEKVRQAAEKSAQNDALRKSRTQPLQVTDIPDRPTSIEQFTLKLALTQAYSLWKYTPDLGRGVPVVKVSLDNSGAKELPPFLFYHGGVRELFHTIRTLVPISRDRNDRSLFLLNDESNVLRASVGIDVDELVRPEAGGPVAGAVGTVHESVTAGRPVEQFPAIGKSDLVPEPSGSPVNNNAVVSYDNNNSNNGSSSSNNNNNNNNNSYEKNIVLSGALSVLTTVGRFARGAASLLPSAPPQPEKKRQSPPPPATSPSPAGAAAAPPSSASAAAAPAPVVAPAASAPPPAAPVLHHLEPSDRAAEFKTSLGEFQLVEDYVPAQVIEGVVARPVRSRGVEEEIWICSFDAQGRISEAKQKELKHLAFTGGIHPTVRREMWKYLLGYYPWDSTYAERQALKAARTQEYIIYKTQWTSVTPLQAARFHKFRDRKHLIEKDVMRTDRTEAFFSIRDGEETNRYDPAQNPHLEVLHDVLMTYAQFDFDTGYCQGMNDLLSPILSEVVDEVDAFWCFKGLMDRMAQNFRKDQSGMNNQLRRLQSLLRHMDPELLNYFKSVDCDNLYFTFRWMLLHFKREFDFDGVKMVWDAIWSAEDPENFHLFIVFAILQTVRDHIMMERLAFDSLVQLCNAMGGKLSYPEMLANATHWEQMFRKMFPNQEVRARILL